MFTFIIYYTYPFLISLSSLNERILKVDKNAWLNLIGTIPEDENYIKWSSQDLSTYLMKKMHYFFVPRRSSVHHLYSFWIVADLRSLSGRQLLREALEYVVCNLKIKLYIISYVFSIKI